MVVGECNKINQVNFQVFRDYFGGLKRMAINSKRILGMVWGDVGLLITALVSSYIFLSVANFGDNWVRGQLINKLISLTGSRSVDYNLIILVLFSGVLMLLPSLIGSLNHFLFKVYWFHLEEKFELMILTKKAELDVATHEDKANQDLFTKVNENGVWRVRNFLDRLMYMVQEVSGVIFSASVIVWSQPWIFLLIVVGTLPELIAEAKQGKRVWGIHSARAEVRRRYWDLRNEFHGLSGLIDLRIFQNSGHFLKMIRKMFVSFQNEEIKNEAKSAKIKFLVSVGSQGSLIIALIYFVSQVINGQMQVGTLTFVLASIAGFRNSLSFLFSSLGSQYQDNLFVSDVFKFLDLTPVIKSVGTPIKLVGNGPVSIEFVNVSFAYPGTKKYVMKNLNLKIEAGDKVAIVGVNGAGKTTLIKLLCRFYDPTKGTILINGADLRMVDLESWYERLGVIFQDYSKYKFVVKEGIALGRSNRKINMNNVQLAAENSGSSVFVKKWKKGYDQMLGKGYSDAVEPSVGQWQKLALARTFYRDPSVFVLDEPTASIDAEAEEKIFNRLDKLALNKTVILISHRFSTVRRADKIVVIKGGKLIEQGKHEQLLASDGVYAKLFKLQAKGYR
jgi:ABC-type multidrug transport system fused ATPase/permease subunit